MPSIKCSLCNRQHDNEVDQFAEHISAYGEVEAWQMWKDFALGLLKRAEEAVPMLLWCPQCAEQHVDAPQPKKGWTNPAHRSHECQFCGYIWRPSDHATNGVKSIDTKGSADAGSAEPQHFETAADFDIAVADLIVAKREAEKRAEEAELDAERMLRNERAFHHLLACVQRAQSFDPEITKYPDDELSPYDVLAKGVREALDISHGEDAARGKNG